ncbi:uncharacterized protein BO66DRAFT_442420 [Aspergillus aculeatinus CBS 121060]|uniref:Uncharacterized protein n=1 Tax=Aspergillus aculeatinus CBS 121060 TaxID=1448322 RepID=A0ACD1GXW9_9EURO|nr:hypothetical protein BO66DRAFT_442420 [Aspergillus aculeatinus CBS 121060]RAH66034.1 hypothetical protein BO66DRAFT_442420 [Aspergillus aculeatinus CBS 121060]
MAGKIKKTISKTAQAPLSPTDRVEDTYSPYTDQFFADMATKIAVTFPYEEFAACHGCSLSHLAGAMSALVLAPLSDSTFTQHRDRNMSIAQYGQHMIAITVPSPPGSPPLSSDVPLQSAKDVAEGKPTSISEDSESLPHDTSAIKSSSPAGQKATTTGVGRQYDKSSDMSEDTHATVPTMPTSSKDDGIRSSKRRKIDPSSEKYPSQQGPEDFMSAVAVEAGSTSTTSLPGPVVRPYGDRDGNSSTLPVAVEEGQKNRSPGTKRTPSEQRRETTSKKHATRNARRRLSPFAEDAIDTAVFSEQGLQERMNGSKVGPANTS